MGNRTISLVPPAPASIDVGLLVRAFVLEALREKADAIAEGGRFEDHSYLDDDRRHHMRGGFWNSNAPSVSDGYGKGDVEDVLRTLRSRGVSVAYEDIDAFLAQLVRTGALTDAELTANVGGRPVTIRLDMDTTTPDAPEPELVRVRNMLLVEQRPGMFVVRPAVGGNLTNTHIVLIQGGEPLCTCASSGCGHVAAVRVRRAQIDTLPSLGALRLSEAEHTVVLRTLLPVLAERGLFDTPEKRDRGNQPRNTPQCALQLLLRELLGRDFAVHVDTSSLKRLRVIDRAAGSTTLDRYRVEPAVVRLLGELRDIATRGVRARGIGVARQITERGDHLAAEIVHALRLESRLTNITSTASTKETA